MNKYERWLAERLKGTDVRSGVIGTRKGTIYTYYDHPEVPAIEGEVDVMQLIAYEERRKGKVGRLRND